MLQSVFGLLATDQLRDQVQLLSRTADLRADRKRLVRLATRRGAFALPIIACPSCQPRGP